LNELLRRRDFATLVPTGQLDMAKHHFCIGGESGNPLHGCLVGKAVKAASQGLAIDSDLGRVSAVYAYDHDRSCRCLDINQTSNSFENHPVKSGCLWLSTALGTGSGDMLSKPQSWSRGRDLGCD
jgi:hypothetical protein